MKHLKTNAFEVLETFSETCDEQLTQDFLRQLDQICRERLTDTMPCAVAGAADEQAEPCSADTYNSPSQTQSIVQISAKHIHSAASNAN